MASKFGPSWPHEVRAAGIGDVIAWNDDRYWLAEAATPDQVAAAAAAFQAHDPAKPKPRNLADNQADLDAIDAKTARAVRDFAISSDKTRLTALEAQAAALRAERATLSA